MKGKRYGALVGTQVLFVVRPGNTRSITSLVCYLTGLRRFTKMERKCDGGSGQNVVYPMQSHWSTANARPTGCSGREPSESDTNLAVLAVVGWFRSWIKIIHPSSAAVPCNLEARTLWSKWDQGICDVPRTLRETFSNHVNYSGRCRSSSNLASKFSDMRKKIWGQYWYLMMLLCRAILWSSN